MANEEQLALLKAGVEGWNEWMEEKLGSEVDWAGPDLCEAKLGLAKFSSANLTRANLSGADLRYADLTGARLWVANLRGADLRNADLAGADFLHANLMDVNFESAKLYGANLTQANLKGANLSGAFLSEADLSYTDLTGANFTKSYLDRTNLTRANISDGILREANLSQANLLGVNLSRANLSRAILRRAYLEGTNLEGANLEGANLSLSSLIHANLNGANLSGADLRGANLLQANIGNAIISKSKIYGISAWDLEGEFKEQKDLMITEDNIPPITVDNIKVAQFIYLILNNEEIRDAINTLTSKTVLILGRFAIPERKAILDALRNRLRKYDLLPIVFDFDRPTDKDFTETIKTLAGMCYFVIADVTNPKSSPLELQATVPDYQIPFVPIIHTGEEPFAMMANLQTKYDWVLDTISYDSLETLMKALKPAIIDRAIQKHNELQLVKAQQPKILSASDFIDDKGLDNPE